MVSVQDCALNELKLKTAQLFCFLLVIQFGEFVGHSCALKLVDMTVVLAWADAGIKERFEQMWDLIS